MTQNQALWALLMKRDCTMGPKYSLGQKVRVKHIDGWEWEGEITYVNLPNDVYEYEVSNAPYDTAKLTIPPDPGPYMPGYRWSPLVWEHEIVEVVQ